MTVWQFVAILFGAILFAGLIAACGDDDDGDLPL